ncbi:MAG: TolC family protein [Tannerellaceae bacterium]
MPHHQAKLIAIKPPPPPKYTDHFPEKRFQSPRRLNLFTAVSVFTHREDFLHAPRRPKKVFTKTQKRLPRERYFVLTRTKQGFHKNQTAFLQEGCMVFASKQQQIHQKEPHLPFFDNRPFSKTPFSEGEKSIKITHLARKIPSKSKNRHLRHQTFSPRKRPLLYKKSIKPSACNHSSIKTTRLSILFDKQKTFAHLCRNQKVEQMKGCIAKVGLFIFIHTCTLSAQQKWTLRECIEYARQENIQIKQTELAIEGYDVDIKQAKAALFPSLNASMSQQFANNKIENENGNYRYEGAFNGQYGINASWTIYDGKQNLNSISQAKLNKEIGSLNKDEIGNNIEIAITRAYLQVIYAWESIKNNRNIVETSASQLKQAQDFLDAGSFTRSEYAQVETQYSSDKYNLVLAQNSFANYKLLLKQLLELEYDDSFDVAIPDEQALSVNELIPDKESVYLTALSIMPQVKASQLGIDFAEISKAKAKAGYLPTISLTGSAGTGNVYNESPSYFSQLNHRFNQQIGVTVSVPIFDNRRNKSAVQKASLDIQSAQLNYVNTKKDLLRTIEELSQEASSSLSKYYAARDKLSSSQLSYELVNEQYELGMRNITELTTEKNNYANALQELLQAKYNAILGMKLLEFYEGKEISL